MYREPEKDNGEFFSREFVKKKIQRQIFFLIIGEQC